MFRPSAEQSNRHWQSGQRHLPHASCGKEKLAELHAARFRGETFIAPPSTPAGAPGGVRRFYLWTRTLGVFRTHLSWAGERLDPFDQCESLHDLTHMLDREHEVVDVDVFVGSVDLRSHISCTTGCGIDSELGTELVKRS